MHNKNTGVLVQHQAALAQGQFLIQKCDDCGQHIYFPREVCPHCGSDAVQFVSPSGQGTVYAVTTVRRKPADGGDYNVSLIDLDEGPRLAVSGDWRDLEAPRVERLPRWAPRAPPVRPALTNVSNHDVDLALQKQTIVPSENGRKKPRPSLSLVRSAVAVVFIAYSPAAYQRRPRWTQFGQPSVE
mgnify:CR=1 FL=1